MKAFAVIAGIISTVAVYVGLIYVSDHVNVGFEISESDELAWFIGMATWIPIVVFLGSITTGMLIQPSLEKSWISFFFYSPGLVFAVPFLCLGFLSKPQMNKDYLGMIAVLIGISLTWLIASTLGVALGHKLRSLMNR